MAVETEPVDPPRDRAPGGIMSPALRLLTVGILAVITLGAFEDMAVSTALPTAARAVHGISGYGWLFSAFLIANLLGMVICGGWVDRAGPTRPAAVGLLGFCAGLLLAGAASTLEILALARAIQGISAGLLFVALYVLIGEHYPTRLQPRMSAAVSSAWVVPSLTGPTVSGALTQTVGWRWVFWGIVPLVVIAGLVLMPTLRRAPRRSGGTRAPARLLAAVVVAGGLVVFQASGHLAAGWTTPVAIAGVAIVAGGLSGLLPPGWWRLAPGVPGAVTLRGLLAAALFGLDALIPLSLQAQHHFAPLTSGIPLTCGALGWTAGAWVQGRDRWSVTQRFALAQAGFLLLALAAGATALVVQPWAWGWAATATQTLAGCGMGIGTTGISVLVLRFTSDARRGHDLSSLQIADAVGAALATGFGGILIARASAGGLTRTHAFTTVDLTLAAVALLGGIAARRVRRVNGDERS